MSQNQENGVEEELPNTNGIMSVLFFQYKKLYSLFTNLSEKLDMFVWLKYKLRIFIFWVMLCKFTFYNCDLNFILNAVKSALPLFNIGL